MKMHRQESKNIVGIVGGAASGKDTVADLFSRYNYVHVSSSNLVRDEIAARNLTTSREIQTSIANEMRMSHGPGYWLDLSLKKAVEKNAKNVVISGLYSPGEGEYLTNSLGGVLVGVSVAEGNDMNLRFERLKNRANGQRDRLSYEDFVAAHERENSGTELHETNISMLLSMAQYVIYNSSDLNNLQQQTIDTINKIEGDRK